MKKILSLLLLLNFIIPHAYAGQEGHGGDIIVSEFLILANEVNQSLYGLDEKELPIHTFPEDYSLMIRSTKVSSEDRVFLGGAEVDAINFPNPDTPKIIVGRERWLDDRIKVYQKKRLVLHEYLSLLGYDDSFYNISHKLIKAIMELEGDSANLDQFINNLEDLND